MKAIIVITAFLFFLLLANPIYAARSLSISADKGSLFGEEELNITASASGFTDGETIYIKGAFHKEGSTNYFGYTKKGEEWIKNGESTLNQRSIQVGQWDQSMIIKSDFADSGYNGEGAFKFKVGFYYITSGGNLSSVNWSTNSLDINLSEPDPTPTPSSTPAPTSTPVATSTPTKTPTPTPLPNIPTSKPSPSSTPKILPTDVLGESTKKDLMISPTGESKEEENVLAASESKEPNNLFQKILIFLGVVFIASCVIVTLYKVRKEKMKQYE